MNAVECEIVHHKIRYNLEANFVNPDDCKFYIILKSGKEIEYIMESLTYGDIDEGIIQFDGVNGEEYTVEEEEIVGFYQKYKGLSFREKILCRLIRLRNIIAFRMRNHKRRKL